MPPHSWIVGPDAAGMRLDKFLSAADRLGSRGRVVGALDRGKVFLNDAEVRTREAGARLAAGDVVRLWMDRPGSARRPPAPIAHDDLETVFEDDSLVVLNKRAGLLTVPLDRREDAPSVYQLLEVHLKPRRRRPFVVHRIDRDTSGLVVFAKDSDTQRRLKDQFKRRAPERVYLAIVHGRPEPASGVWRDLVAWDDEALLQRRVRARDPRGEEAVSEYRTIETFADASLIEVRLGTGKQNQIRLQAQLRGHPLVGEQRYIEDAEHAQAIPFLRQALHAHRLSFAHPADDRTLSFEAPMPADMKKLVGRLRHASRIP